jgi:hypothetical protein
MEALGVLFVQYLMMVNYEEPFKKHIAMNKAQYCYPKRIGSKP